MKIERKEASAHSSAPKPKQQSRSIRADLSAVSQTPQQIVARFQEDCERLERHFAQLERLPPFAGQPGRLALDVLERINQFRDTYRQKVKDFLAKHPDAIPNWHLQEGAYVRELGQADALKVWNQIKEDSPLSLDEFLSCCRPGLIALENAIAAAEPIEPYQARELVNQLLGDLLTARQNAPSLRRDKESSKP